MHLICSDLEGVWIPEIWINVAQRTGIDGLKLTTRDVEDYDQLMTYRLNILKENNITLKDIQDVIATLKPLDGAYEMIKWLQSRWRLIVVSDTFTEFADPLIKQLDYPLLLCHSLEVDENGMITDYKLRQADSKREAVKAFQQLKYEVIAFGDSYNDMSMLAQADKAFLYRPPQAVIDDFPQYNVATNYREMREQIESLL